MKELEEMKNQLSLLQSKLENQTIVSNRLLRSSMRQRTTWVNHFVYFQLFALLPFIYIFYAILSSQWGFSWWLYAYTVIMCTLCVGADVCINNFYLSGRDFQEDTMLELARKLARQKQLRWYSFAAGMVMLLPWLIWICYEFSNKFFESPLFAIISILIGGFIGFAIGFSILIRMQRNNDLLMRDIQDLISESDSDLPENMAEK